MDRRPPAPTAPLLLVLLAISTACPHYEPIDGGSGLPDRPDPTDGDADADEDEDGPDGDVDTDGDADDEQSLAELEPPLDCGYPSGPYGCEEGMALRPFYLWTCDGHVTTLPEIWCGHRVTVLHVDVTWCGECQASLYQLQSRLLAAFGPDEVPLYSLLVESEATEVATTETCEMWRRLFDVPPVTYVPPEETLAGGLADLTLSGVVPVTVVIDREGIVRLYSSLSLPDDLEATIEALLEP